MRNLVLILIAPCFSEGGTSSECDSYCAETGCSWTEHYKCPNWDNAHGEEIARAKSKNDVGFKCCCQYRLEETHPCGGGRIVDVYYIRHGQGVHNIANADPGEHTRDNPLKYFDSPLSDVGVQQVFKLKEEFKNLAIPEGAVVAASPLRRAFATVAGAMSGLSWWTNTKVFILPVFEERSSDKQSKSVQNCAFVHTYNLEENDHCNAFLKRMYEDSKQLKSKEVGLEMLKEYTKEIGEKINQKLDVMPIYDEELAENYNENKKKKIQERFDLNMNMLLKNNPEMRALVIGGHADIFRHMIKQLLPNSGEHRLRNCEVVKFQIHMKPNESWKIVSIPETLYAGGSRKRRAL